MEKVLKIITFGVRDRHVAFPASEVREIVDSGNKLKPLFYSRGGAIKGIIEYEGEMISVLDTPNLLDVRSAGGLRQDLVHEGRVPEGRSVANPDTFDLVRPRLPPQQDRGLGGLDDDDPDTRLVSLEHGGHPT